MCCHRPQPRVVPLPLSSEEACMPSGALTRNLLLAIQLLCQSDFCVVDTKYHELDLWLSLHPETWFRWIFAGSNIKIMLFCVACELSAFLFEGRKLEHEYFLIILWLPRLLRWLNWHKSLAWKKKVIYFQHSNNSRTTYDLFVAFVCLCPEHAPDTKHTCFRFNEHVYG